MARPKNIAIKEVLKIEPIVEVKKEIEEKINMPIMMRDTKEIKCIKKSEYDCTLHICL